MAQQHTPERRAQALGMIEDYSLGDISRKLGIPKSTLSRWVQQAGLGTSRVEKVRAAVAATHAANEERRAELRGLLLEYAVKLMRRMDDPHIDFKGKDVQEVTFPVAPAAACQHYATSVGILIDKYRLEQGEVTGREEVRHDFSNRTDEDLIAEAEAILRDATEGG